MKKLICLLMLLLIPVTCSASQILVKGHNADETVRHIEMVTDYFQNKYNLSLKKDIIVRVTKTKKEYAKIVSNFYTPALAETSYAVTMEMPAMTYIVVDGEKCGDRIWFTMTHELVHAYQNEHYPESYKSDYAMTEGKADLVAAEITGYPIKIKDHGIPSEKMKDYKGHGYAIVDYGVDKVDEQVRFYASKNPGFFP